MRKEADDAGPVAELQHWRQRMAKFNSLLEQIKTKQCKTVIGILLVGKSKVLKVIFTIETYSTAEGDTLFYNCIMIIVNLFIVGQMRNNIKN